jgi:sarcosine oxidase, subunit gamma
MEAAGRQTSRAVRLCEVTLLAQLNLRVDRAAAALVEDQLGVILPQEPGAWAGDDPIALWLGPGEWLIVSRTGQVMAIDPLGSGAAVVDVSDQRAVLELSGPRARDVLAGGCSVDLHARAFRPGCCVQTLLAHVNVILAQTDSEPTYLVLVRRSEAAYLATWLIDAMTEHQST